MAEPEKRARKRIQTNGAGDKVVPARRRRPRPEHQAHQSIRRVRSVRTRVLNLPDPDTGGKKKEKTPREWEDIEVEEFVTDPAYVRVNAGVTRQLREYESLRMDVSVSMPCYRERIEDTYLYCSDLVAELLSKELEWYVENETPEDEAEAA